MAESTGVLCTLGVPAATKHLFVVMAFANFTERRVWPIYQQTIATDARAALLKIRHGGFDELLRDLELVPDGWYVARWSGVVHSIDPRDWHSGRWVDSVFFPPEEKEPRNGH